MRTSIYPRPLTPAVEQPAKASFAALPRELFCNIVAYLGPTSSSLCSLSQVTRDHNAILTSIGDVMLHRARLRFRTPLQPKSIHESSVSLFVRHARVSKAVHDKLEVLNEVLKKEFPIINNSSLADSTKFPVEFTFGQVTEFTLNSRLTVELSEVQNALNIALCLLGCPKQHYFEDTDEAQEIANDAATTALEWRVSSLCSKIGARAYKYAKSRMCRRYEREDELFSAYAVTDEVPLEDYSDYEDDDDISMDPSEMEADEDMIILDKASLVLQHVVLREQRKARRLTGHQRPNTLG
eukprot:CAMPEP_0181101220 /NCGR_PEP_ID=MMETSP1071-20121207/13632_1 /TAXON_ID=35127 /ORGANISM="Thalassiosira sp., Strain NH16" /LENGTH=295 /DNA_ID=CAMNT_0023184045 /DNA_START=293 /DNA_END=1180 /DNA_ORIENTATION=-